MIGSQVLPFDDVAVAREALDRRRTQLRCRLRPMLYHLLAYLQGPLTALNLDALVNVTRYITVPHGRRQPVGAGDQPAARAVDDPQAARVPGRPGDPAGGPDLAPAEGRHADDGRAADPDGRARADAALGGSHERLRLDRRADDRGVRRRRLPRRLPEDRAPRPSRPVAALQDGAAGRRSRSSSASCCWCWRNRASTTRD